LITGATGFIGANLVHLSLKEGASVAVFTRNTSDKWRIRKASGKFQEYTVDLSNKKETEGAVIQVKPDIIFHNAAYGGNYSQNNPEEIFSTNLLGTINLLNACSKAKFDLFVHSGSSSEYGIKSSPFREGDILKPMTDYGVSKASATLYCQTVANREKLKIVIFRLFSPYGYYEEAARLIPSIIISSIKGKNPELASPEPVRDFVFIEDIMKAYINVVEKKNEILPGEIFNIAYGTQYSVGEIVDKIINMTGRRVKPQWGKILNSRIEPGFWQADIRKAREILGWQPLYDLEAGLKKDIDWFKKNMALYN